MRYLLLTAALAGCSWTTFDDLGKTAWAQSTQTPNIGSTDYAVAIVGTTNTSNPGQLSVLSSNTNSYSTLTYDAKGNATLGPSPQRLGQFFITSLGTPPIFVANDAGECSVVAQASNGTSTYIVVYPACTPGATAIPVPSPSAPDAAAYLGTTLVVAAGTNIFVIDLASGSTTTPTICSMSEPALGLGADATAVWAWTMTGKLVSFARADLLPTATMPCTLTSTLPTPTSGPLLAQSAPLMTGFMPASGATVQVLGSPASKELVVLAGHAPQSSTGTVIVADTTGVSATVPPTAVGAALSVPGLQSAVAGQLGDAGTFVALGFPSNETNGTVELHALDTTTGALNATVAEKLADSQNAVTQYGRSLAIMKFNATSVLVVAAKNEVYAYFRTLLYGDTRQ